MTDTFASGPSSPLGGSHENPQSTSDVTNTLAELERKLRELEHELAAIGRRRASPLETPAPHSPENALAVASRLIDEAIERDQQTPATPVQAGTAPPDAPAPPVPAGTQPQHVVPSAGPRSSQLGGLAELRRFRDRLERFAAELAEDYEQVLGRVMADFSAPPTAEPSVDDTIFEGRVELGVGPFYDIGSLSAFERQVAAVPHASDVAVRRFEASHAVLDLSLSAPVALVRELRTLVDTGFSVREIAGARLMLTFDDI